MVGATGTVAASANVASGRPGIGAPDAPVIVIVGRDGAPRGDTAPIVGSGATWATTRARAAGATSGREPLASACTSGAASGGTVVIALAPAPVDTVVRIDAATGASVAIEGGVGASAAGCAVPSLLGVSGIAAGGVAISEESGRAAGGEAFAVDAGDSNTSVVAAGATIRGGAGIGAIGVGASAVDVLGVGATVTGVRGAAATGTGADRGGATGAGSGEGTGGAIGSGPPATIA